MKNYSWLQQRLHHLALSSQIIREVAFEIENSFITPKESPDNNVFITGLARSGTTILLNAIHQSDEFASLSYRDMPFVLAPNLWSKLFFNAGHANSIERAHGDGIKVSTDSPEAFEEVFWMTFDQKSIDTKHKFKLYTQLINQKYNKNRYLSKNNQNIRRIDLLSSIFPNSKILIPFRDPLQHSYSLLNQHQKFIKDSLNDNFISNYMKWIGHTEFGPNYIPINETNLEFYDNNFINHWIEQWYTSYKKCHESVKKRNNIYLICYERLCESNEYWLDILNLLNVKDDYNFNFIESNKRISIDSDQQITEKAYALYSELKELF